MSDVIQTIPGGAFRIFFILFFFCQLSSHEAKGSKRCNHAPHNRAKYKDVTFLWFFKTSVTVIPCFVSSPFLHLECLIFAPVFINVSFNIVMCNRKVT